MLTFIKKHLKTIIKWSVSIGLIYYILQGTDFSLVASTLKKANISMLFIALLLCFVGYFISSTRWKTIMSLTGHTPNVFYLVKSFMVAMFFNNILPSTIGGDISRMVDTWKVSGDKAKAFAIVFLDRFFGVYALFIFSCIGYLTFHDQLGLGSIMPIILLGIISATAFLLFLIFQPITVEKLSNLLSFIPQKWKDASYNIITTFYQVASHKPTLLKALGLSFLLQSNVVLHFYFIAMAIGINIDFFALFMIIPVALIIMMIPISVNGIGIRETIFVFLLGIFNVPKELAISFAFIAFCMIIIQGLLGGIVYLLRKG